MSKKRKSRITESIEAWKLRSRRSTRALQRDVRIMVLNGVCMAYHRNQDMCRIVVAAEHQHPLHPHTLSFREAEEAADEVSDLLRKVGCSSATMLGVTPDDDMYPVDTVSVTTSNITSLSTESIEKVRSLHWEERKTRAKKEGGPRERKKKQSRKK